MRPVPTNELTMYPDLLTRYMNGYPVGRRTKVDTRVDTLIWKATLSITRYGGLMWRERRVNRRQWIKNSLPSHLNNVGELLYPIDHASPISPHIYELRYIVWETIVTLNLWWLEFVLVLTTYTVHCMRDNRYLEFVMTRVCTSVDNI